MQTQSLKFGSALLLAGLVANVSAPAAHAQFGKISEQQEIEAGRQSAAQAIKEYGRPLSPNDPRQQRVARIGAMFAAQSTRRNIPYSYTVLQNDKVLNAFAAPGGPIFVTTKLISTAANDAELAYVLGHETGHIERKHIVNAVAKQQKLGLGVGILGAILGRGKAGNIIGGLANAAAQVRLRGFSRDQENDSDDYGVRAMARLGFDPRAAVSMLGKLGGGDTGGLARYLATHPSPDSRQQRVTSLIQSQNLLNVAQNAGGPQLNMSGNSAAIYGQTNFPSYPDGAASNGGFEGEIRLDAPLRVVNSAEGQTILAPVASLARYAGGRAVAESRTSVLVSRGGSSLRLELDSDVAVLNGRRVRLSTPARIIDGRFYAPLGTVTAGLGGQASYDNARGAVRVEFDGRGGFISLR
ncbi:MAG: M48 family metalloprotease [Armatimonadetes bacterium]|nr:M48 family metalloprotease [Armatimonadota bacterium]